MFSINFSLFVFILATLISLLEIQVEGENGWAKDLPCWRAKTRIWKIYSLFQGGKQVTGYHLALNTLEVFIFHAPFFGGVEWTWMREIQILSLLPLFWINQDFTWFVWNPYFGLKRFKPKYIPWHNKWLGKMPADYFPGMLISGIIAALAGMKVWWLRSFLIIEGLVFASTILAATIIKRK